LTVFDLLFAVVCIGTLGTFAVVLVLLVRRRSRAAAVVGSRWALCFGLYIATIVVVSLLSGSRVLQPGERRCFDDWCLAVESARVIHNPVRADIKQYSVGMRISSRARGETQREKGVAVYLIDAQGHRYGAALDSSEVRFDLLLGPGESVAVARRFEIPSAVHGLALIVRHEGFYPGALIIGDEQSLFHKPMLLDLPESRD
jgi:hypothetical protein